MRIKDERTKMVNEVLCGIKVIKLYAWEVPMERVITKLRNRELTLIRKLAFLETTSDILNSASPFLVSFESTTVLTNQIGTYHIIGSAVDVRDVHMAG